MSHAPEPENITRDSEATPPEEPSIVDAPTPDAEAQFVAETSAHSRKTRIGWEVVAAVAAVVLVGAGVAYALLARDTVTDSASGSVATATVPSPGESGAPSTDSSPPASALGTMTGGVGANPGTGSRTTTSTRPGVRRPTEAPATPGAPLTELTSPPPRTVAMLVVPKGFTAATYAIAFTPYGWGPGGRTGGRILINITSSKPTNASAKVLDKDFANRNAAVWCSPKVAAALSTGGAYTGLLQVRPQGDVGTLYLMDAKLMK